MISSPTSFTSRVILNSTALASCRLMSVSSPRILRLWWVWFWWSWMSSLDRPVIRTWCTFVLFFLFTFFYVLLLFGVITIFSFSHRWRGCSSPWSRKWFSRRFTPFVPIHFALLSPVRTSSRARMDSWCRSQSRNAGPQRSEGSNLPHTIQDDVGCYHTATFNVPVPSKLTSKSFPAGTTTAPTVAFRGWDLSATIANWSWPNTWHQKPSFEPINRRRIFIHDTSTQISTESLWMYIYNIINPIWYVYRNMCTYIYISQYIYIYTDTLIYIIYIISSPFSIDCLSFPNQERVLGDQYWTKMELANLVASRHSGCWMLSCEKKCHVTFCARGTVFNEKKERKLDVILFGCYLIWMLSIWMYISWMLSYFDVIYLDVY